MGQKTKHKDLPNIYIQLDKIKVEREFLYKELDNLRAESYKTEQKHQLDIQQLTEWSGLVRWVCMISGLVVVVGTFAFDFLAKLMLWHYAPGFGLRQLFILGFGTVLLVVGMYKWRA